MLPGVFEGVQQLVESASVAVSAEIPRGTCIALLGYPSHPDPGSASTWLGELELMRRIGAEVRYVASAESYSRASLLSAEPDMVVLHGGGSPMTSPNMPSLFADLAGYPIVQLSSRCRFTRDERTVEAIARHGRIRIFAGCQESLSSLDAVVPGMGRLAPDSAFLCGLPERRRKMQNAIVWLARSDGYAIRRARAPRHGSVLRTDWAVDEISTLLAKRVLGKLRRSFPGLQRLESAVFEPMALARVRRGLELLGSAGVGVTDRLHGHILFSMCGVPHVLLDDRNGRLRSFHATWTSEWRNCRWAACEEEALELALELLGAVY